MMKHCPSCGSAMADETKFCTKCGCPIADVPADEEVLLSRCARCGYQPERRCRFCPHCGASMVVTQPGHKSETTGSPAGEPVPNPPQGYYPMYTSGPEMLLKNLCSKLRISAILLVITAGLQALAGLVFTALGIVGTVLSSTEAHRIRSSAYSASVRYSDEVALVWAGAIFCILLGLFFIGVSIPNFVSSIKNFAYIKKIRQCPVGIVAHFRPVGKTVALLVVNILCSGLTGIIGSIFALLARNDVERYAAQFLEMERQSTGETESI